MIWCIYRYIILLNTLSGGKSCLVAPGVAAPPSATETALSPWLAADEDRVSHVLSHVVWLIYIYIYIYTLTTKNIFTLTTGVKRGKNVIQKITKYPQEQLITMRQALTQMLESNKMKITNENNLHYKDIQPYQRSKFLSKTWMSKKYAQ